MFLHVKIEEKPSLEKDEFEILVGSWTKNKNALERIK